MMILTLPLSAGKVVIDLCFVVKLTNLFLVTLLCSFVDFGMPMTELLSFHDYGFCDTTIVCYQFKFFLLNLFGCDSIFQLTLVFLFLT